MRRGAAHVRGLYTVPALSGTQLKDGCDVVWNLGLRCVKLYLTADYAADYPLQSSWSSSPTTLAGLAATTQFAAQLSRSWHTVGLTCFTFANGSTNWWRADQSKTKFAAEYTELRALAEYLLTTYAGTGRRFVVQNWEGDWAFMDSFTPDTSTAGKFAEYYAAFLGVRQRAIEDARKAIDSDCQVLHAVELNRVLDARLYAHRARILSRLARRIRPDWLSYSAYDSTIVDQGGWGASHAAWVEATRPAFRKALRAMAAAFPGVPMQIGEYGFPEGSEKPVTADVDAMIRLVDEEAQLAGVTVCQYWQALDNEVGGGGPGTYRGYWLRDPTGTLTIAGAAMQDLGPGE